MRAATLFSGLLVTIFVSSIAKAQVDFDQALRLVSDTPSQTDAPSIDQSPSLPQPLTTPHVIDAPQMITEVETSDDTTMASPQPHVNMNNAIAIDANYPPCVNSNEDCYPSTMYCYPEYDEARCCLRRDRGPAIPRSDPPAMGTWEAVYATPDYFRGFWSTYPQEKARHGYRLQQQLNPPVPPACRSQHHCANASAASPVANGLTR